jgi:c-di-GMP-binding flagellar brake protein YcgR
MKKDSESLVLHKPGHRDRNAIIRDRISILALLNQGYHNNTLFGISAPQNSIRTTGTLAAIYPKHGLMAFITPEKTLHKLAKNTPLQIAGRLHGAEFHFTSTLLNYKATKNRHVLQTRLPDFAYHPQLRQEYRVSLLGDQRPFQAYIGDIDDKLEGYAVDISASGLGAIVTQRTKLKPGNILENCVIELSDGRNLSANIEVRHINYNPQRRVTRLGGRFHGLTKDSEFLIKEYVNHVQREEARRLREHTGHTV